MINVGVSDPNLLQSHAELFAGGFKQGQIAARIDDGSLHRFIAPDDGTVLLEWGDGNGFVLQHAANGSLKERLKARAFSHRPSNCEWREQSNTPS